MIRLFSYVLHLFSVKGWPDETVYDTTANVFLAFFMPYTGIWPCYVYFNALPIFLGGDDLHKAKWAGALCMVARLGCSDPGVLPSRIAKRFSVGKRSLLAPNSNLNCNDFRERICPNTSGFRSARISVKRIYSFYQVSTRNPLSLPYIHGQRNLPEGYVLLEVPSNAVVSPLRSNRSRIQFQKLLMGIAAIGQLLFACLTLYWGQGLKQKKAGYAAYSLTLIVALLIPDYSTRYLVRNTIMEEGESQGRQFSATAGILQPGADISKRYPETTIFQKSESYCGKQVIITEENIIF